MARSQILFILRMPPPYGGGEIVSELIYQNLRNKYNFLIFKRKAHNKAKQSKASLQNVLYGLFYIYKVILYISIYKPKKIFIGLPKSFLGFVRNAIIINLCYILKIKVLAEFHGMSFPFLNNNFKKYIYKKSINNIYNLRVLGNNIKDEIIKHGYKNEICVIDNAVKIPFKYLNKRSPNNTRTNNLLYFGAISELKGFLRIIEFAELLYRKGISFKIIVIGEWISNYFYEKVNCYLISKGISHLFDFKGMLFGEEKFKVISLCHINLHFTYFDGQPLTIIETMALGIPTISTKIGAIPEMITNYLNGFLIDNIEQAIQYYLEINETKNLYNKLSNSCKEIYLKRFRPIIFVKKIEEFINK